MSTAVLKFGIEMEFLLRPKSDDMKRALSRNGFQLTNTTDEQTKSASRRTLREVLANILNLYTETRLDSRNYTGWVAADERTLEERPGYWRCEIISRILRSSHNWQAEVDAVFEIVRRNCDILLTSGCSTHVHISPSSTGYTAEQLGKIMKAAIYFDRPLEMIMPGNPDNQWAQSNVKANHTWRTAVDAVPQKAWAPLFDTFDKKTSIPALLFGLCDNRYVTWNFSNVLDTYGTIEFRRPPGAKSSAEARHWIALALGYVSHALSLQDWAAIKLTKTHPTTSDLRRAITRGTQILGPSLDGALGPMADVDELPTGLSPESPEESEDINGTKEEKSKEQKPFAQAIDSRPNTPISVKAWRLHVRLHANTFSWR